MKFVKTQVQFFLLQSFKVYWQIGNKAYGHNQWNSIYNIIIYAINLIEHICIQSMLYKCVYEYSYKFMITDT